MRIGIDLDEVLCEFLKGLVEFHNSEFGSSLVFDDFFSYNFWEVWGGTRGDAVNKVYSFHKSSYFYNLEPVSSSVGAVEKLSKNHTLFIITARQSSVASETLDWVKRFFGNSFEEVILVNHLSKDGDSRRKGDVCDELKIDVMIEDSVSYAKDCLRNDRKVILFNKPWNKEEVSEKILRVDSWDEVVNVIED